MRARCWSLASGLLAAAVGVACQPADSSLGAVSLGADGIGVTAGDGMSTAVGTGTGQDEAPRFDLPDPSGDDSLKLDVAAAFDLGAGCPDPPCSCRAVDILFVVDNSAGLAAYHGALAAAFPDFLAALEPAVGSATSLHVGVTSTTMGASRTRVSDGCSATGDRGAPADSFYETPDVANNGLLAAQGRLNLADGMPFFALEPGGEATADGLRAWFAEAVALPDGSQIEMAGAAAAWATDPVGDAVNAGFVRDDAAMLFVFVVGDPDQTPSAEAADLVARVEASKAGCGGLACIVGGALLHPDCTRNAGLLVLLNALGGAHVDVLPDAGALATMGAAFGQTLAPLLGQACR